MILVRHGAHLTYAVESCYALTFIWVRVMPSSDPRTRPPVGFRGMGRYLALGFQMVAVTAVGAGVGFWLDGQTGKSPLFLILFFILGSLGGMTPVWREIQRNGDSGR
jgi:hypothetical protein